MLGPPVPAIDRSQWRPVVETRAASSPPRLIACRSRCSPGSLPPQLPPAYAQLSSASRWAGVKFNAVYDKPFWRDAGPERPASRTPARSRSPTTTRRRRQARRAGRLHRGRRQRTSSTLAPAPARGALECLARYFGDGRAQPTGYVDQVWARTRYTRGAYGTYNPPGVLTSLGRSPAGRWGAPLRRRGLPREWPGYMDGAIRSGERAAGEINAALG